MKTACAAANRVVLSMSDGYAVQARYWPAGCDAPARGAALYLHGIQSHGGWYEWSGALLAACGLHVLMPDRRGSGRNTVQRGDVPSRQRWLQDLDEQAAWLTRASDSAPLAVVGVSWGGKLACAWLAQRAALRETPLLLIAPGLFAAVDVGPWAKLRIGLALLSNPTRAFDIPLNDPQLFTDDPQAQAFIQADTLKLTRAAARLLFESRRLDGPLRRIAPSTLGATTLLLASRERIIRNEPTQAWCARACRALQTHVLESAHTLEFDPHSEAFESRLRCWVRELNNVRR